MQTTVAAYLTYLTQEGRVVPWLEDNRLWWHFEWVVNAMADMAIRLAKNPPDEYREFR